jgi:DNA-binding transcriptional LysR family regulator
MDQSQGAISKAPIDDPHMLSGDYWGELRVFLAVAKAKSFNRAAEELNLSRPTVSSRVKRLQDLMGAQLLVPSAAGIALTKKGKKLAERLIALDHNLWALSRDLRSESHEVDGDVRVTCTEALTGLFIVPAMKAFNTRFPNVHFHFSNPVSLISFRDNQSDIFVGLGSLSEAGLKSTPAGFLHLIGIASHSYLDRYGHPTRNNLSSHLFIKAGYYASRTPAYASWHDITDRGTIAHQCDNSFAYALLVKDGAGIGLLGNFTLADSEVVPIGLDVHVKLPIFIHARAERLQARPVKAAFDWLCEVFGPHNLLFSPKLILDAFSRDALAQTFQRITVDADVSRRAATK